MRNTQTDPREHNYCSCQQQSLSAPSVNLFWYTPRVPVTASFPDYEGVMVAHRQPTFRCAQKHLKGTFEGY